MSNWELHLTICRQIMEVFADTPELYLLGCCWSLSHMYLCQVSVCRVVFSADYTLLHNATLDSSAALINLTWWPFLNNEHLLVILRACGVIDRFNCISYTHLCQELVCLVVLCARGMADSQVVLHEGFSFLDVARNPRHQRPCKKCTTLMMNRQILKTTRSGFYGLW